MVNLKEDFVFNKWYGVLVFNFMIEIFGSI